MCKFIEQADTVAVVVGVCCNRHARWGEALMVDGEQAPEEGGDGRMQGGWPGRPLPPRGCPTVRRR
jgi:hypothetical protein